MKLFAGFFGAVMLVGLVLYGCGNLSVHQEYENTIGSYWNLADRASSLQLKSQYLNQFVAAVDSAHLQGHDAIVYPTVQNDVAPNIVALKSLQTRLREIQGMDVQSFQYQQAISQITAQEQGEAGAMLGVIEGVWYRQHHIAYWDWVSVILYLVFVFGALAGVVIFFSVDD